MTEDMKLKEAQTEATVQINNSHVFFLMGVDSTNSMRVVHYASPNDMINMIASFLIQENLFNDVANIADAIRKAKELKE